MKTIKANFHISRFLNTSGTLILQFDMQLNFSITSTLQDENKHMQFNLAHSGQIHGIKY